MDIHFLYGIIHQFVCMRDFKLEFGSGFNTSKKNEKAGGIWELKAKEEREQGFGERKMRSHLPFHYHHARAKMM